MELTLPQLRTLNLLHDGPKRMSDVASHLGVGLPSVTAMIDRLLEKALVEREHSAIDRRVVLCRLTAQGRQEVERFLRIRSAHVQEMASCLSDSELEVVVNGLEVLLAAVEQRDVGAERERPSANEQR